MTADELARLLDELGRRLGPAGEHVFRLAVERVVLSSIVWTLFGLLILGAFVVSLIVMRRWRLTADSSDFAIAALFVGMFGGSAALLGVWVVAANVINLLTPEYTALRDILGAVRL